MKRLTVVIIVALWVAGLALFWERGGAESRALADRLVFKLSKTLREGNYAPIDQRAANSEDESANKPSAPAPLELAGVEDDLSSLAGQATPESIAPIVAFLSRQESRFTGYPGNLATAEFVKDRFFEIFGEENVLVEKRLATVPYEEYSRVAFLGETEELWSEGLNALHPFSVKLHSFKNGEAEGHLVYGGNGDLANLNGRDLDGAIVLLDFKSGDSFITLRGFGARAFIFLSTGEVAYKESVKKSPDVPIDAPCFFADVELSRRLLEAEEGGGRIRLETKSAWREVEVSNFVGVFPGSPDEIPESKGFDYTSRIWDENVIVVSGFYDSPSVVPAKAPGRTNAASIIGLLETAKAVRRQRELGNGNKFRLVFVANTGHFQAYEGIIDFMRRHARSNPNYRKFIPEQDRFDPRFVFSLEMTDADPRVMVSHLGEGVPWGGNWVIGGRRSALGLPFQRIAHTFQEYSARIYGEDARQNALDGVMPADRNFMSFFPVEQGAFASDVCNFLGVNAIGLTTPDDARPLVNTPADTMDKLNVENVVAQANTLGSIFCAASRDALFFERANLQKAKDLASDIVGSAVWYDVKSNFATPAGRLDGGIAMFSRFYHHANIHWGVRGQRFQKLRFNEPSGGDDDLGYEVKLNGAEGIRLALSRVRLKDIEGVSEDMAESLGLRAEYELRDGSAHTIDFIGKSAEYRAELPSDTVRIKTVSLALEDGTRRELFSSIPAVDDTHETEDRVFSLDVSPLRYAVVRYWEKDLPPSSSVTAQVTYRGPFPIDLPLEFNAATQSFEARVDSGAIGIARIAAKKDKGAARVRFANIAFEDRFHFPIIAAGTYGVNTRARVDAFKMDRHGQIAFATDEGRQGAQSYPNEEKTLTGRTKQMLVTTFPCRAVTVLDIMDPRYLTTLDVAHVLSSSDSEPERHGAFYWRHRSRLMGWQPLGMTAFIDPDARLKMLLSSNFFGVKYLLINAPDEYISAEYLDKPLPASIEDAAFPGYEAEDRIVYHPAYNVARDIWVLNESRIRKLQRFGIRNQRLEDLHNEAFREILKARQYREEKAWDKYLATIHKAWGLETRAYPEVKATAVDTVKGLVFYFALLLPFCFFLERLLFGFTDFRKQIAGFWGIFFVAFLVLRAVHPAFRISSSPYVILLAFVILTLGVLVAFTVIVRCSSEIKKMKNEASGMIEADVGRLAATSSAIILGISNLRKRRIRTGLTALTLILLTFAVLSFTSVNKSIEFWKIPTWDFCAYEGALLRNRDFRIFQDVTVEEVQRAFAGKAKVAPRAWQNLDMTQMAMMNSTELGFWEIKNPETGQGVYANAFMGLTPQEIEIPKAVEYTDGKQTLQKTGDLRDALLPGSRWFLPEESDAPAIILSDYLAEKIGVAPEEVAAGGAVIRLYHEEFRVVGLFDHKKFDQFRQLDKEAFTPLDLTSEGAEIKNSFENLDPTSIGGVEVVTFYHLSSRIVAIMPYERLLRYGGGTCMMAIYGFEAGLDHAKEIEDFMLRAAVLVFFGDGERVSAYNSVGSTSLSGLSRLFIPILIAAAIVFNTMLGAVYERTREIGIFCSVGLAPNHIGALFLAESFVFATLAAVIGYLVAQVLGFTLASSDMFSEINLNYSSLSAVAATMIVMVTVVLSTLYPSRKAAEMAVPDVNRKWVMERPKSDLWEFEFPFTIGAGDAAGLNVFLYEFFKASSDSSAGRFFTNEAKLATVEFPSGGKGYEIQFNAWLAPYDMSISQHIALRSIPTSGHGVYRVEVAIQRLSGEVGSWVRMNREFLNTLRKRFLVWRTVSPALKQRFAQRMGSETDRGNEVV